MLIGNCYFMWFYFLFIAFALNALNNGFRAEAQTELQLEKLYRIEVSPLERFDFSGILKLTPQMKKRFQLKVDVDFLLINDKSSKVYQGRLIEKSRLLRLEPWIDLAEYSDQKNWDLEDLAFNASEGSIDVVQESDGHFYEIRPGSLALDKLKVKKVEWKNPNENEFPLSDAFGAEGLGVSDGQIFLAKEKFPLAIFKIQNGSVEFFPRLNEKAKSQTAIRFSKDGKQIYLLDREGRSIWQTKDLRKKEEKQLSFEKAANSPNLNYESKDDQGKDHPEWGNAEALEVDEDHFYIGFDNNDKPLRANKKEKRAALAIFKRPKN